MYDSVNVLHRYLLLHGTYNKLKQNPVSDIVRLSYQLRVSSAEHLRDYFTAVIPNSPRNMRGPLHEILTPFRKATFGMGCFWACDALFGGIPGVLRTRVGYSGGSKENPKYRDLGDHTEVIEIDFDPKTVSYEELLREFWDNHEYGLTTITKRQYMSLILYHDDDQKRIAEISMKKESHKRNEELITVIESAGTFYDAEDYHQKYRLQQHRWLVEALELTPELLKKSHVAAKLNSYLSGVGSPELIEKDLVRFRLSKNISDYVLQQHSENLGGNLYC